VHAVSYFAACIFDIFGIASPFCIWFSLFEVDRKFYCAFGVSDTHAF
jgi:hypothetical protein